MNDNDLKDKLLEEGKKNPQLDFYELMLAGMIIFPWLRSTAIFGFSLWIIFFSNLPIEKTQYAWSLVGYELNKVANTSQKREINELKKKTKH